MFDLSTPDGLKAACEEAERTQAQTYSEQREQIYELLKYVKEASLEERESESFHRKIWDSDAINKISDRDKIWVRVDVGPVINDSNVRKKLAEASINPLPTNRQEKIDFLNKIQKEIIDDLRNYKIKAPAKINRMLATLFPTEFTKLIVKGKKKNGKKHDIQKLRQEMGIKPDKTSFIGQHRQVLDRLDNILGPVPDGDLRSLANRMTLPDMLLNLTNQNGNKLEPKGANQTGQIHPPHVKPNGTNPEMKTTNAQNIILYGPPGTGKTYTIRQRAIELILGEKAPKNPSTEELTNLFLEYQKSGHIEFVTFHQSYGYEEFIEGLRPILDDDNKEIRYELHDGIFKRMAMRADEERNKVIHKKELNFEQLWQRLMDMIRNSPDRIYPGNGKLSYRINISGKDGIQLCPQNTPDTVSTSVSKKKMKNIWERIYIDGPKPSKLISNMLEEFDIGNKHHITAPRFVYDRLIELNNDTISPEHTLPEHKPTDYVLIIDEINRGNVSKILGELITLLEPDKRLGAENELRLPLAYSPEQRFGVPPNLHILGTMNTADRSIALMDAALRRRFTFEEVMPDKDCLQRILKERLGDGSPLVQLVVDLFEILNKRIRFLYDRDHQIGHAYFLRVESLSDLRFVFAKRVIPLLQEYFYGDWNKICMVLGSPYSDAGKSLSDKNQHPMIQADTFSEKDTLGFDHDDYEDRVDFRIAAEFQNTEMTINKEHLLRAFLGVLQLKQNDFDERLKELMDNEASPDQEGGDEETGEEDS